MALVSNILTQVFITLIAVAGVYVLTGLTGMFSLGQAAFMAIGSYASGLLVVKAHMPLVPAIIIAVALATLVGYLIGYPVVRLRRDYISLVTLGFGEAIAALLNRMTNLTGGASGFTGIPRKTTLTIAAVSAVLEDAGCAYEFTCRLFWLSHWWLFSNPANTGDSASRLEGTSWLQRLWASTSSASR